MANKILDKNKWSTRDVIYILLIVLGISTSHLITKYNAMRDIAILFVEVKHLQKDVDKINNTLSYLFGTRKQQENTDQDEGTITNNGF